MFVRQIVSMLKLYLDIDGVLLTTKHPQAAEDAAKFVAFITGHFDCYWLTTHCQRDAEPAVRYCPNTLMRRHLLSYAQ